ncbi:MAG: MmcQ/YjbR family DNA-binding protein [Solirubrobacterales bacterium]|nr:MmcQ/YjbR family DNA-binding protein [Solirubrobacterales bacterium]MCB8915815.1 MmcQ/YjbR family DNA-binding protein [Thermoleophilales bacterium]
MTALPEVERIALELPEAEEGTWFGQRAWNIKGKTFVWERPLRQRDEDELGDAAPDGVVIGVRVPDELIKQVLVENEGPAVFTIDHFEGFNAVLIDLDRIEEDLLGDLIADAWRTMAPARFVEDFDSN